MSAQRRFLIAASLLAVATLAAFGGGVLNGFVSFDDDVYLIYNDIVRAGLSWAGLGWAFTSTHAANWHPVTWLAHMATVDLFGMDPIGHHAVGIALHVANALLLLALLSRLTGALWRPALVAALFALHPLHVESVAWASELKDLLATLFSLLCLLAWLRHLRRPGAGGYLGACALFALALMSKPMPVTLPFLLLLLDWWPLGRWAPAMAPPAGVPRQPPRLLPQAALWIEKLPLFLLAAASVFVTLVAQGLGGAVVSGTRIPFLVRASNALMSLLSYLEKCFLPTKLSFYYRFPPELPVWWLPAALTLLCVLTVLALRAARRRPWLGVGWLWYLGTLMPVIGLVQVGGQAMADRYTYLPLTGIFVAVAWAAAEIPARRPAMTVPTVMVALAALAALGSLTRAQVALWRNDRALSLHALALDPDNWMAHTILGIDYVKSQRPAEALPHLEAALRVNPEAETSYNMAVVQEALGRPDLAVPFYREALRYKPAYPEALNNLGVHLAREGKIAEAVTHYREALRLRPMYAEAGRNLAKALAAEGNVDEAVLRLRATLEFADDKVPVLDEIGRILATAGRFEEAYPYFRRILDFQPASVVARNNMGNVLADLGRIDDAVAEYREALRVDPGSTATHFNLANALVGQRKLDEAVRHFQLFLEANPDHARGNFSLGNALAAQGKFVEAVARYRRAIELDPTLADARFNLGNALADLGRPGEAVEPYLEAVRLNPGDPDYRLKLGDAYQRLGRREEALAVWRAALEIAPGHTEVRRRLSGT